MNNVYYIGGSPCSGKSTVAEALSEMYGMTYFKLDDCLEKYAQQGIQAHIPLVERMMAMDTDETWLRDPRVQCEEELEYYRLTFQFAQEDIAALAEKHKTVITEGAALLPALLHEKNVDTAHYFCMVPEREFQIRHYRERPWIDQILADSSDKEKAFANWMERDALFGEAVHAEALRLGYTSVIVDGAKSVQEMIRFAETVFGLR